MTTEIKSRNSIPYLIPRNVVLRHNLNKFLNSCPTFLLYQTPLSNSLNHNHMFHLSDKRNTPAQHPPHPTTRKKPLNIIL